MTRKIGKPVMYWGFDRSLPFPETIAMIRDAGFEMIMLGGSQPHPDYKTPEGLAALQKTLALYGITVDTMHAPFPEGDRLFSLDEAERRNSIRLCRAAVDAAVELASGIVVVHLIQPYGIPPGETRERMIGKGRDSIAELAEYASGKNARIALENGQRAEYDQVLSDFLVEFDPESVGFCYDSGHENVKGTCFQLLEQFGHRLITLHLHDNLGTDTHLLPGEGNIQWDRFSEALSATPYTSNLSLEAQTNNSRFKDPVLFLKEAMRGVEQMIRIIQNSGQGQ